MLKKHNQKIMVTTVSDYTSCDLYCSDLAENLFF